MRYAVKATSKTGVVRFLEDDMALACNPKHAARFSTEHAAQFGADKAAKAYPKHGMAFEVIPETYLPESTI